MARQAGRTPAARIVAIVAVAVLGVGVGVLAVLAYQRANPPVATHTAQAVPTFTLGVQTQTPTPTPAREPEQEFSRASERFLASGAGTLWRAVAGACGSADPLVERSNDGGRSWTDVTPRYVGIAQVASLDGLAVDAVESVLALGRACEAQAMRSFTNGEFWEPYPDVLAISRFVDLTDPAVVHFESGRVSAPCDTAHGLRALRQAVALVCDSTAYVWRDAKWTPLPGTDAAAVAIAGTDVIAAHVTPGCNGLALTRFAGGDPSAPTIAGCADVRPAGSAVAVVVTGDGIVVWSGKDVVTVR